MFFIEEDLEHKNKEFQKERALKLAKFYKEEGLYEDSIKSFELYIFLSGEQNIDYTIYKEIAICYSLTGLTAEAINNLKKASKLNQEDISVIYLLAQMYEQSGMYDEAEKFYNEIIKKDENMASVYYQLGEIYYKKGNVELAIKNWGKVVEIEPTNSYAHYLLGSLYYYKKEYKHAEEHFKSAQTNGFKSSALYNYLGKVYSKLGEREKAKINFLIALERDKYNMSVYRNYLNELNELELEEEKIKLFDLEDYDLNKLKLSILYKFTGNSEKAKEMLEKMYSEKIDGALKNRIKEELDETYTSF